MNSLKAIIAGSVFIVITMLFLQLVYLFIAVGYNALASDFSLPAHITELFRYLIGLPVFLATMFTGGYISANIANQHSRIMVLVHSVAVAMITVGSMMYFALQNSELTLTGIVVLVFALIASSAGGFYWLRGK